MQDYPTDEDLEKIEKWNVRTLPGFIELMKFIETIWAYGAPYFQKKPNNEYVLVTGGWSGNEEIIEAMEKNLFLMGFYWESSERGGRYVFKP